ncbi:hypothetical protein DFJ74DRAFT_678677 [Hyaloraphidium curvatum]|nr:hypothetical protein DFJ74DRAFT_678677 [Hyaloraphidium curvatum]
MLPFPFLCMGCCLFETADTVFDSAAKEVSFANYPGFLMCLKKDRTVPYADVANVALSKTNMRINHQSTYATVLVLRNGEQLAVGGAALMDEAYARAAAVHQFLFAAGNPGYRVPQSYEMVL